MYLVFKTSTSLSKPENGLGDRQVCGTQESQNGGEGSWGREGQALGPEVNSAYQAQPGAARAAAGARGRRPWIRLTCPFTEPRSDPRLVTQTPDPKGREERARDAQGQVGHGARAHPVQEAGGR